MINGLGVVGWGVGGIEAEAVMLGQPIYMLLPEVVGFKLTGKLPEGATATDLVLTVTQMLRQHGVVGKFVEFYGPGLVQHVAARPGHDRQHGPRIRRHDGLLPRRCRNAPLPRTDRPLRRTDRSGRALLQGTGPVPHRSTPPSPTSPRRLQLDLSTVEPSMAGPKRPQDRIVLSGMKSQWEQDLSGTFGKSATDRRFDADQHDGRRGPVAAAVIRAERRRPGSGRRPGQYDGETFKLKHGSVVIAAITSCTNTSNPVVMIGAGLLAQ